MRGGRRGSSPVSGDVVNDMRSSLGRLASDRGGVSAIIVGLSLTGILGFAGLAVDASLWYSDKRLAQTAADSAAFSAANTFNDENETASAVTNAKAAAIAVAAAYGLVNGSGGVSVTVNNPPTQGAYTTNSSAIEVIITKPESVFFSSLFLSSVNVVSRAVGAVTTTTTGGGTAGCILQLGSGSSLGINMSNGVAINANNCGVDANGTGSGALTVIGGADLTAASINVVGGITQNNGGVINDSGAKVTNGSATADPYASYSVANAETGFNMTCPNSTPTNYSSGGAKYTLNPGVYCGGISLSNGASATFNPGIYIIDGGTLSLQSGTNIATGGVTFVLTGTSGNYAGMSIANGATLAINAPSSGPTAGIAFYGDPNNTSAVNLAGGANITANGAYYFPGSTVDFSNGVTNSASCTQLIANNIVFTGGTNFSLNCSGYGTKQIGGTTTTTTVAIVE
jgi:Flp pilus assembly protein TadG